MSVTSTWDIVEAAQTRLEALLELADAHPDAPLGDAYLDRTVTDVLGHLIGWHELFLGWVETWRAGEPVAYPAEGYGWDQLVELNAVLYKARAGRPYQDERQALLASHVRMLIVLDTLTEAELFDAALTPWTEGEILGAVAHECLGAHYEWGSRTMLAAHLA